jgi:ribosomal protein S18 acetylase RimI-like enzyme
MKMAAFARGKNLLERLEIRPPEKGLGSLCETILRTLPTWFGNEAALVGYVRGIERLDTYTAWLGDAPVGFFSVKRHNPRAVELYVLAVMEEYHRHGIGSALYRAVETDLKSRSFEYVQVKTLGPSSGNEDYVKTRQFYISQGFCPIEEFSRLWGDATPCLLMVKKIE